MERHQSTLCVHRWVLGEPRKGSIRGVCRRCGARRSFPSGLEFPEAVRDYVELNASLAVSAAATLSAEEPALV